VKTEAGVNKQPILGLKVIQVRGESGHQTGLDIF